MTVKLGSSEHCFNISYVLLVVQEASKSNLRPLASYSEKELAILTDEKTAKSQRRQDNSDSVYIAANVSLGKIIYMYSIYTCI